VVDTSLVTQPDRLRALDCGHAQHLPGGHDGGVAGFEFIKERCKDYPFLLKKIMHSWPLTPGWRSFGYCERMLYDTSWQATTLTNV
jgi:hypothetical protein